jgi:putative intracellular protease/amidase
MASFGWPFFLEEFATPYFVFKDAGVDLTAVIEPAWPGVHPRRGRPAKRMTSPI